MMIIYVRLLHMQYKLPMSPAVMLNIFDLSMDRDNIFFFNISVINIG